MASHFHSAASGPTVLTIAPHSSDSEFNDDSSGSSSSDDSDDNDNDNDNVALQEVRSAIILLVEELRKSHWVKANSVLGGGLKMLHSMLAGEYGHKRDARDIVFVTRNALDAFLRVAAKAAPDPSANKEQVGQLLSWLHDLNKSCRHVVHHHMDAGAGGPVADYDLFQWCNSSAQMEECVEQCMMDIVEVSKMLGGWHGMCEITHEQTLSDSESHRAKPKELAQQLQALVSEVKIAEQVRDSVLALARSVELASSLRVVLWRIKLVVESIAEFKLCSSGHFVQADFTKPGSWWLRRLYVLRLVTDEQWEGLLLLHSWGNAASRFFNRTGCTTSFYEREMLAAKRDRAIKDVSAKIKKSQPHASEFAKLHAEKKALLRDKKAKKQKQKHDANKEEAVGRHDQKWMSASAGDGSEYELKWVWKIASDQLKLLIDLLQHLCPA